MSHSSKLLTRRACSLLLLGAGLAISCARYAQAQPMVIVHKSPKCGCCGQWIRHVTSAGFTVRVDDLPDVMPVKQRLGVPLDLASCHTSEVDEYAIEGHVPAPAIRRLLAERPSAQGLAVPGMPSGSPGMGGGSPTPYEVVLFGPAGRKTFGRYKGASEA